MKKIFTLIVIAVVICIYYTECKNNTTARSGIEKYDAPFSSRVQYKKSVFYENKNEGKDRDDETVDARTYDLGVWFWEESFRLYNLTLLTNVDDPVLLGKVPDVRSPRRALKTFYINTTQLNFTYGELKFNSTECEVDGECRYSDYSTYYLGIYHCSSWTVMVGCSSGWSRLDTLANTTTGVVSANTTILTGAFALAEYICGDDVCDEDYGESFANCPQDCTPATPQPPAEGGGGGGGGGGQAVPPAEAPTVPYEIRTNLIYVTLEQGEYEIHSMEVLNNQYKSLIAEFSAEGLIWDFVQIEKPKLEIASKSIGVGKIKLFTLPTTTPGIYTGDILTKIDNDTYRTPVTIKVEEAALALLDVQVKALTKAVAPGEDLIFEVVLLNMGETVTIEDIITTYTIRSLNTDQVITKLQETLGVEQKLNVRRNITIPLDTPFDRYMIEANVTYWYGVKNAFAADSFEVTQLPPILIALRALFMNWITYIILFGLVPLFYGGRWLYYFFRAVTLVSRSISSVSYLTYSLISLSLSLPVSWSSGLNSMKYGFPWLYSAFCTIPVPVLSLVMVDEYSKPYFCLTLLISPVYLVLSWISFEMLALIAPLKSISTCDISHIPNPHFLNSLHPLSSATYPPLPPYFGSSLWTSS
ncbi:hypothetical protein ACFLQO_01040 [Candidatus Aenigmatarchaeota archaeon]